MEYRPDWGINAPVFENYERYLKLKNKKSQTIHNKIWILKPFFDYIKHKPVDSVTKEDIENFILKRQEKCKPNTVHVSATELKFFFKWYKPQNNFFDNIKTKSEKNKLPEDALITPEELLKLVRACNSQRDRAFIFLLWDTAGRLNEILQLKIGDVVFDKYGGVVTVNGKTGMRKIRIVDSVPDLQLYINQKHGKTNDYLFPARYVETPLTRRGTQNMIDRIAEKAGIERHIHPHLFRHSKLTDLCKQGVGEMELRLFAGWENTSTQPATYLHLSMAHIDSKILALHGIIPEKEKEVKITTKTCPRCQTVNAFDSIYCRSCSFVLDNQEALNIEKKANEEKEQMKRQIEDLKNDFDLIAQYYEGELRNMYAKKEK